MNYRDLILGQRYIVGKHSIPCSLENREHRNPPFLPFDRQVIVEKLDSSPGGKWTATQLVMYWLEHACQSPSGHVNSLTAVRTPL